MFQRLELRNVVLRMAEGELCPILLKLYVHFGTDTLAKELWMMHPILPADFVNTYLVPFGNKMNGRSFPIDVHLIFKDEMSRDKRLGVIRHVFCNGTTQILQDKNILSLFGGAASNATIYDPDLYNNMGESLFMSLVTVEMSRHTKQYEQNSEDNFRFNEGSCYRGEK